METKTTRQDMERIRSLLGDLIANPERLPVSFDYAGKHYSAMPAGRAESRFLDANIIETRYTAELDKSLRLVAEIETYRDFPAVEWTLWFEGTCGESALLENVRSADLVFGGATPSVLTNNGDFCNIEGYTNTLTALTEGTVVEQASRGGRPCDSAFPYQRILFGDHGFSIAIGWPGQWDSKWEGVTGGAKFSCGQQTVHTVIREGERFRSPRMAVVAFEGDLDRGINVWRRWYHAHVLPRAFGNKFPYMTQTGNNGGGIEWTSATEEQQLRDIAEQRDADTGAELWWIDAGWYPCNIDGENNWPQTGTWKCDPARFPRGFKPIGDACLAAGMELIVWFEPERVRPGTELAEEHPEWMLHRKVEEDPAHANMLLDLTNPDCFKFICERVSSIINEGGITIYRQDFNFEPLMYWRDNEEDNRKGMLENKYLQGYLAYWDYLLMHNPNLMIDSCASGGRRNDLETMRRSVPFHQTDFGYGHHPIKQKFTQLLAGWIPYYRGFSGSWDTLEGDYIVPSYYAPPARPSYEEFDMFNTFSPMMSINGIAAIKNDPVKVERQKKLVALYKRIRHFMRDDFYTLTTQHADRMRWSAWQYHSPEQDEGYVQCLRNNGAPEESFTACLKALNPDAVYTFENGLTGETLKMSGRDAMEKGLTVSVGKREGCVWIYKSVR